MPESTPVRMGMTWGTTEAASATQEEHSLPDAHWCVVEGHIQRNGSGKEQALRWTRLESFATYQCTAHLVGRWQNLPSRFQLSRLESQRLERSEPLEAGYSPSLRCATRIIVLWRG